MNYVCLIGNLGKDPEEFETRNGKGCRFSLATQKGGVEGADWHSVTVWGSGVPACLQYLHKGSKVCVQGSIRYDDKVDNQGNKITYTGISCYKVEFLGQKVFSELEPTPADKDDIPF